MFLKIQLLTQFTKLAKIILKQLEKEFKIQSFDLLFPV